MLSQHVIYNKDKIISKNNYKGISYQKKINLTNILPNSADFTEEEEKYIVKQQMLIMRIITKIRVCTIYIMDKEHYFDFWKNVTFFSYGELDKEILEQFNFEEDGKYVTSDKIEELAQGDIFDNIPLFVLGDINELPGIKPVKAILLSNSCDASRRDYLNFAPFIPIELMGKINNGNAIRKNQKLFIVFTIC